MKLFGGSGSHNGANASHNNQPNGVSRESSPVEEKRPVSHPKSSSEEQMERYMAYRQAHEMGQDQQRETPHDMLKNQEPKKETPHDMLVKQAQTSSYGENTRVQAPPPPSKQKKKKSKVGAKILMGIFSVLLLAVSAGAIYWFTSTKAPEIKVENTVPPIKDDNEYEPNAEVEIVQTETRDIGRYYTILVVAIDEVGGSTDSMMLARYDAVNKAVNVVALPRDTLVNKFGGTKKLNSVYYDDGEGDIEHLKEAVGEICGFKVDNYMVIELDLIADCIDKIGGVDFDVPVDMHYDNYPPADGFYLSIHFDKGMQHLTGEEAVRVMRWRKNNDGTMYPMADIDRINTQQNLIKAVAKQALTLGNVGNLFDIASMVLDRAITDLKLGEMQWYAKEFLSMDMGNINMFTIPNTPSWIRGGSYVSIDVDAWMEMVNEYFNPMNYDILPENCNILYQVEDTGDYVLDPDNYVVTNGEEIRGGLNSFRDWTQYY